jgi:DNA-binding NarL/FixJ family response regulator
MTDNVGPIRVLIVEDVDSLRESLYQLLNTASGFVCVGALPNAMDVLAQIRIVRPNVVLMDINMPGKSGIEAVREIRQQGEQVTIVMQTIFEDDDKVFESILAGANGYILKSTPEEQLLEAIQEAQLGGAPMTPTIATKVLRFLREQPKASQTEKPQLPGEETLNDRQHEVLELLMDGASYKMIAEELFISMDTVRYHIKNIYRALHINSRNQLVRGH